MILMSSADRPVLDVVEVVLDPLLERGVAAPAVDLGPAGDPGLHLVAQHVLRDPVLELLDEVRALRARARRSTCRRCSTFQSCGSSSRSKLAQPAPDRRAARVVVARPHRAGLVFGVDVHRSEFEDLEGLAVETHALLRVEHRAGRRAADERRDRSRSGIARAEQRGRGDRRRRSSRLSRLLNPRSGTSLRLMIGTPSRFSSRARSAMNCSRSGTTCTSTPSRLVASTMPSILTCSSSGSAT